MIKELDGFLKEIKVAKKYLEMDLKGANDLDCSESILKNLERAISITKKIEKRVKRENLKPHYLNEFKITSTELTSFLTLYWHKGTNILDKKKKETIKRQLESNSSRLETYFNQKEFNFNFFNKIGHLNNNVVVIGANGSGKTTLANTFKKYTGNNDFVISSQRLLLISVFDSISNPSNTILELKNSQKRNKSNKNNTEFDNLQQEFSIVLKNLIAENALACNHYWKESKRLASEGEKIESPNPTKLEITINIWNSLIEYRQIECIDGINITVKSTNKNSYPAVKMSDGEKAILYLVAQILQAPSKGFIIIDEPEMYLHKTILKKLWDILENERKDCLFIYLTHDLDFATSRTTAKKIWLKSFTYPDKWEIEDISTDEIPEILMFELLGSRKNILFCEGEKGSIDERVYTILFPELTIMPVGSCFDVINHTKAFNKLKNVNTQAFGIIDSDHHDIARLEKLKECDIYYFKVAEVENLFLDCDFLKVLAKQILVEESNIELIKTEVIKELDRLKEIQASNYVSTKVNYYFTDSDVSRGNQLVQLETNYQEFLNKVSINDWYEKRILELNEMINNVDYNNVLISFNNKGIKKIASKHFNISDFTDRCIKLLQSNVNGKKALNKYFPIEIKTAGNTV
jgi:ABC-type uncharacterized transport system ATPase subunit